MKIHHYETQHLLPVGIDEAWEFFSTPKNLNSITPEDMHFQILSGGESKAYAGQVISYKIKPLFNISMQWVTEITQCKNHKYFIDEQRFGPYKFWHHQHHFKAVGDGVLMTDILHYALPYGMIGELLGKLFLHKKISNIFKYRKQRLRDIFQFYPEKIENYSKSIQPMMSQITN